MLVLHLFVSNVLQRNFLITLFNIASSYSIIVEFCHISLISVACCPVGYDGKKYHSFIHSYTPMLSISIQNKANFVHTVQLVLQAA